MDDRTKMSKLERGVSAFSLVRQNRATVELIAKQAEAQEWIQSVINERFTTNDFAKSLEDGVALCKLALAISPGSIKKIKTTSNIAFTMQKWVQTDSGLQQPKTSSDSSLESQQRWRKIENIGLFLEFCLQYGVNKVKLFHPPDLIDRKNLMQVANCIHDLANVASSKGFKPTMEKLVPDDFATTKNTRQNKSTTISEIDYEIEKMRREFQLFDETFVPTNNLTPEQLQQDNTCLSPSWRRTTPSSPKRVTIIGADSDDSSSDEELEIKEIEALKETAVQGLSDSPSNDPESDSPGHTDEISNVSDDDTDSEGVSEENSVQENTSTASIDERYEGEQSTDSNMSGVKDSPHSSTNIPSLVISPSTESTGSSENSLKTSSSAELSNSEKRKSWKKEKKEKGERKSNSLMSTLRSWTTGKRRSNSIGRSKTLQQSKSDEPVKQRTWKLRSVTKEVTDIDKYYKSLKQEAEKINDDKVIEAKISENKEDFAKSLETMERVEVVDVDGEKHKHVYKVSGQSTPEVERSVTDPNLKVVTDFYSLEKQIVLPQVEVTAAPNNNNNNNEDDESKNEKMRLEVINEFLLSERYYVRDLEVVVYLFIKRLRSFGILTPAELESLFINIELILKVNSEILSNLMMDFEAADMDIQRMNIGQVFIRMVDYLKIYSVYSSNHAKSIELYEKLKKERKQFFTFLEEMDTKPECQGANLLSFLIKPVQRICKYPLLFMELLRYTPTDHIDYANIDICLKRVQSVAEYVNEKQREIENVRKTLEIQENMIDMPWNNFSLVSPSRFYIRESTMIKVNSRGKVQERVFFLFNDMLLYCKPLFFKKTLFQYKGHLPLHYCLIKELSASENSRLENAFQLVRMDNKRKYTICANSDTERKEWLADLNKLIDGFLAKEKKRIKQQKKQQEMAQK